ncbi:MAG: hypothetical protein A2512_04015 [Deltaproteobacteria bacterium RIFOXYD12_FULL_56_24]|nr:MAG: hypothetical protein A2512_04015 [Deltaproteobacteria bacterium RIFOXYD12_FULL_56_24]
MKYLSLLLCLSLAGLCASCASKDQVYAALYEAGNRRERIMRAQMEPSPVDLTSQDQISYDRYKKERDTSLAKDPFLPTDLGQ